MAGFLSCKGTLSTHVEFFIDQHSQVLLPRGALSPFSTKTVFALEIASAQVQDFGLVQLYKVCTVPPIEPIKVPLDDTGSLQCIDITTVSPSKLMRVHPISMSMSAKKLKSDSPNINHHVVFPFGHQAIDSNTLSVSI